MIGSVNTIIVVVLYLLLGAATTHGWSVQRLSNEMASSSRCYRLTQLFSLENMESENDPDTASTTSTDASAEAVAIEEKEAAPRSSPVVSPPPTLTARDMMTAMNTSPRRIFLSGLSASGIALAGNLFGVTSQLLMAFPEEQVAATGLDTYFPRGDYKRYRTADYSLVIPKEWVADTAVELAKAQRRSMSLDYSMQGSGASKTSSVLPDCAFGPPGNLLRENTAGDTNVSVIRTPAPSNFSLRQVMTTQASEDPTEGAQFLLQNFLAGKGRQVTLLSADTDNSNNYANADTKTVSYRFSYRVDRGESRAPLQAVSVIAQKYGTTASAGSSLFTFTVVAPVDAWQSYFATKLAKTANSFQLLTP